MSRKKSLHEAADHTAASVKEQRAQALENAAAYLSAAQAKAAPLAAQAAEKIGPLGEEALKVGEQAWKRGSKAVAETGDRIAPAISSAREVAEKKVGPAIHQAYDTFQKDVLPEIEEKAAQVASHPAVEEATRRSQAALAALKGQVADVADTAQDKVEVAAKKSRKATKKAKKAAKAAAKDAKKTASKSTDLVAPKKQHKVLKTLLVLGGLAAAGAVVARKFLGSADDGWTAREPSETYSWTPKAPAPGTSPAPEPEAAPEAQPAAATPEPAQSPDSAAAEATMTEEGGPAPEGAETTATVPSYVGDNPPEGFVIKGNDRSKKYHVPGSGGYDRTIADVWFSSEEDAQAAGFTKASR